ncbi:MAG TPA: redoxin domain-containing protein [Blastocatellia bacterium]|nr:redoxin domain-containing protein [Blastocatellia bacterium]
MKFHRSILSAFISLCLLPLTSGSGAAAQTGRQPLSSARLLPSASVSTPTLNDIIAGEFEVQTLEGKRVKFASLLGKNRPVLIDFWATWCGPCRATIPHLVELSKNYRARGLTVIGLTIEDPKESQEAVRQFAKKFGINYQIAFAPRELYFEFNGRNPRTAIPQTYIYAADGTLVQKVIGYNPKLIPDLLIDALEKAFRSEPGRAQSAPR